MNRPLLTVDKIYFTGGRRLSAVMIDSALLSLPFLLIARLALPVAVQSLLAATLALAYLFVMHSLFGGSIGKLLLKIRVVDAVKLERPGRRNIILRELLCVPGYLGVSTLVPISFFNQTSIFPDAVVWPAGVWCAVEFLFLIFAREGRTLHGRIGNTIVVNHPVVAGPEWPSWQDFFFRGNS